MSYNSKVQLARLYESTSKNGNQYFRGRMGSANVLLLKSNQVSDSGQAIWNLLVEEPQQRVDYQKTAIDREASTPEPETASERPYDPADFGDPIPF
ncbi:hypothetical protein [Filomicrobium sp.]|uniref:hypothetical protein n=1 Tax=Filomicrobium sp. TaxID=2024831 RepID=UPI00258DBB77|nr:hypothetical protein [Filomicrobium sp.]MCV0371739.1 hypothetical protein [Filomicrobium sp.]